MKLRLQLTFFEKAGKDLPEVAIHKRITFPFRVPFSLLLGFFIGVFFHYLLYRFSLPSQPFIYVNF